MRHQAAADMKLLCDLQRRVRADSCELNDLIKTLRQPL